jgi:hypothetical protein
VDVETYTWQVLPPAQRPTTPDQLAAGIAAELAFARDELCALGLAPCPPAAPLRTMELQEVRPWTP